MRIGKITSSAEYRIEEQFQNCQFLEPNVGFPNWKNSGSLLICQFNQIPKIPNLENFKNVEFWNFRKLSIQKIPKISLILQFRDSSNFWNCTISENIKFSKFCNLKNY